MNVKVITRFLSATMKEHFKTYDSLYNLHRHQFLQIKLFVSKSMTSNLLPILFQDYWL